MDISSPFPSKSYLCSMFIDTHTHLYLPEFEPDRSLVVQNALDSGVGKLLLPNIETTSWEPMLNLCRLYPGICLPMAGIHPTSVEPSTIEKELSELSRQLEIQTFCAIGEIGIDLYWDKTHIALQEETFRYQLQLAKKLRLPVAIHVRNSFNEVWRILKQELSSDLTGVFHCFPGNTHQAAQVTEARFKLGIGGVVTFKNSHMQEVVKMFGPEHIVLETDSPFLAPVPHRGKRNEPAYVALIAEKVSELCEVRIEEVAEVTTENAKKLFNLQ